MHPVRYPSKNFLRSKKKTFVRTFESSNEDCIQSLLSLHCPQVAATQTSAVGVRWKLQLPGRGIETTVTAGSLLNDFLTKPARALTVLRALKNHEEGRRKVKSMPTWVNLSQGGSTLHSPEATDKKASTTSARVWGKDPQPVVSGRQAKNLAKIISTYKKTKKQKKRPRAKPAAKGPPKEKAKLLPGESSESEEFEETEEDEEEERSHLFFSLSLFFVSSTSHSVASSSAWCENAGYMGEIVCCFASLASSVTPGVSTPRRLFNLVPPSRPAQHHSQLC